jgi:hypothetical protein
MSHSFTDENIHQQDSKDDHANINIEDVDENRDEVILREDEYTPAEYKKLMQKVNW